MRFLSNFKFTILLALFVILIIGSIVATARACDGTLVRGVIWFQCIEEGK